MFFLRSLLVALVLLVSALGATRSALAEPATVVFINGTASPVYFNDGDTFRVLSGENTGMKARLAGYNTLESFGPVHQWGGWTPKEMYVLAKMATQVAQKGVWHCKTDGKKDGYGRSLLECHDLAKALIERGLAHAMSVTAEPANADLLAVQAEAILARRGMWSKGTPEFVLTSLHSVEEDTTGEGTYNRLVSIKDGHSQKWKHSDRYKECQKICHESGACMIHVDFRRRFGGDRATCLK